MLFFISWKLSFFFSRDKNEMAKSPKWKAYTSPRLSVACSYRPSVNAEAQAWTFCVPPHTYMYLCNLFIIYSTAFTVIFPPLLLLLHPRRDQNGSPQHGPGDARPVCPGHPGQRHGGPDGRPLRHHLCHCHTNRCQWQPTSFHSQ